MSDDLDRRSFVGTTVLGLAAARLGILEPLMRQLTSDAPPVSVAGELASLGSATTWINTAPLSEASLRGKVVLIDVWTYTCINWLRTLPYVRAWSEKYQNAGLVVIGVHAPEFGFEHDLANVRRAVKDMNVAYPVAVDNEFAIWRAFRNQYWPALYLVDAKGKVRYSHFGEGEYAQSEKMIQKLLAEAGATAIGRDLVAPTGRAAEAEADWGNLRSPENYLGYERTAGFASAVDALPNNVRTYSVPDRLRLNQWALSGEWTVRNQLVVLHKPDGRIACRFRARDVHLVMGPEKNQPSVRFRVLLDGKPPGAAHGSDIDEQGNGVVREQRLYQLIRQPKPIEDRTFEIVFLDPGIEAFAFTFG
jgi:thiol-disulfide isomerase/thioredoxin